MGLDGRIKERLKGKTVLITGGGSGIGRAAALLLAKDGVNLAIVDLREDSVGSVVNEIERDGAGERTMGLVLDVRSADDMDEMVNAVVSRFGCIDVLVHSAGILRARKCGPKTLVQLTDREWDEVVETNLRGAFLCNRAVASEMIRQRKGCIINISSVLGLSGRVFDSAYCASRFGIVGMSEALAEEVREYGVKVQVVMAEAVAASLWDQNGPIRAPAGSLQPERVAGLIRFVVAQPDNAVFGGVVIAPFSPAKARVRANRDTSGRKSMGA